MKTKLLAICSVLCVLACFPADEEAAGDAGQPEDSSRHDVDEPDAGGDATGASATGTSSATGFARLLGVGEYRAQASARVEEPISVEVRSASGVLIGTVSMSVERGEGTLVYESSDGAIATLSEMVQRTEQTLGVTTVLRAAGQTVRARVLSGLGSPADAEPRTIIVEALAPSADSAPRGGARLVDADGAWDALVLLGDGEEIDDLGRVASWVESVGLGSMFEMDSVRTLLATMADPGFVRAVEIATTSAGAPGRAFSDFIQQALHVSDRCATLRARVHDSGYAACRECAELDPDPTSPVPRGLSSLTAALYLPACRRCARDLAVDRADARACARSWLNPGGIVDDADCADEEGALVGNRRVADEAGHDCVSECEPNICESHCSERFGDHHLGSDCEFECICEVDIEAFCREKAPDSLCNARFYRPNHVICYVTVCGDGGHTPRCQFGEGEVCDPTDGDSDACGPSRRCRADCGGCEDCECLENEDCGEREACVGCACVPTLGCEDDVFDFITSAGAWCDPDASDRYCEEGSVCNPDRCRCEEEDERGECGNGILETGEDCDPGGVECDDDQTCTDECICTPFSETCGDGSIQPGEECDPEAPVDRRGRVTGCPNEFYRCTESCTCFAPTCGNGEMDEGEPCDPTASRTGWTCENKRVAECTSTCECEWPLCNNGVVDEGEGGATNICDPSVDVRCSTSGSICDPVTCDCYCPPDSDEPPCQLSETQSAVCNEGTTCAPGCGTGGEFGRCVQVECPPNSHRDEDGCECICDPGFSGPRLQCFHFMIMECLPND